MMHEDRSCSGSCSILAIYPEAVLSLNKTECYDKHQNKLKEKKKKNKKLIKAYKFA